MRLILLALFVWTLLQAPAEAADLRHFEDAAVRAVQFIDPNEGWAVGDEGVIWHSIDGGRNWERQPTGVRASLRALHFLTPFWGWAAGREELPHGTGSVGVLLFTRDGGLRWQRVALHGFPGLHCVRFLDGKTGFVAGEGTEHHPGGVYATTDAGQTWKPVAGPRTAPWLALDFQDAANGVLAGSWGRLAAYRQGALATADVEALGGRSVRGVQLRGQQAVAVGDGGLVLISADSAGATWGYADLQLPPGVQTCWSFRAVHGVGDQLWAVGRPGSALLHSPDRGATWRIVTTGQPLPLHGVFFLDEQRGWAVGEFGSILATVDGGKNWRVQRRGGQRAAILFVHARPTGLPLDTIAPLGGEDGYLAVALQVLAADVASADVRLASEEQRLAAAVRQAGGAGAEVLWQFPVAQHLARADAPVLLRSWEAQHPERAREQMLRQLVLALRMWRPNVVVCDPPDRQAAACSPEALVAEVLHEAVSRAADANVYPEQLKYLGLEPWQASKVYARAEARPGSHVTLDLGDVQPRLEATARDFAAPAAGLLAGAPAVLPPQRFYRLLTSQLPGAANHHRLMQGIELAPGGEARRAQRALVELAPEVDKAIRARRNLQALTEMPLEGLTDPDKTLALVGPMLSSLPDDHAAPAAFAIASQYVRLGQWTLAREMFLLMVDRYPAHPLAADAYRWLIRHNSSSEARRRHELGQFLVNIQTSPQRAPERVHEATLVHGGAEMRREKQLALLGSHAETRQWYTGCLDVEKRLAAFGPVFANDPGMQFCVQSARRNLGDFQTARQWYSEFRATHKPGPWQEAATAELWLSNRAGPSGKQVAYCRQTATRPFLNGQFDDACWQGQKPIVLRPVAGDTAAYYTEAWLAYDQDFLYLALRCRHPAQDHVPPLKVRSRDADLILYDRVSLLLDLDRDYATYCHLQVDQRGAVCEDCWGDRSWNPRWFVAVHSAATTWQAEVAIPMIELTGDIVTLGKAWACNLVRVLPNRGVQAFSLPADVEPRPEGMGLMLFTKDTPAAAKRNAPSKD